MTNYLTPSIRKQSIHEQFVNFKEIIARQYSSADLERITQAFNLQLQLHRDTFRSTGEHYLIHVISVARILSIEMQFDSITVISGLLHNYLHHKTSQPELLLDRFGKKISQIVDGLNKINSIPTWNPTNTYTYLESLHTIFSQNYHILLVKIADHLDSMRNLRNLPPIRQRLLINLTKYVYIPLTYHTGLHYIKSELEDLSLRYINPDIYYKVATQLRVTKANRNAKLNLFVEQLKKCLMQAKHKYYLKYRTKSIFSIWQKMQKGIAFNNIYDLNAVRIITQLSAPEDIPSCFRICESIRANFEVKAGRYKDYISVPKPNGYQSLHLTVVNPLGGWVEIQIRTKGMDARAEQGQAAHWRYKNIEEPIQRVPILANWLADISEKLTPRIITT